LAFEITSFAFRNLRSSVESAIVAEKAVMVIDAWRCGIEHYPMARPLPLQAGVKDRIDGSLAPYEGEMMKQQTPICRY
jgi:hypothetical protein